jgi:alpha-acetolactate decarboxylase
MRHLTALLVIVLLIVLPSCKYFKGKKLFGKKADTMVLWQLKQQNIRASDSIKKVQERLKAIENARLDSIRRVEEERSAFELKYKYNIIVGSFITPEYAKDYAAEFRSRGYDARIIKMRDSRFELVSAEAHESFSRTVARLAEFQDTVEIDAWMYIVR